VREVNITKTEQRGREGKYGIERHLRGKKSTIRMGEQKTFKE
jgi:hypothetical protein